MLLNKCEQCKKLSFYPRKRTLHFPFLPKPANIIPSEKKICRSCAKKVEFAIRRTHKQLKPPILFVIKFYILKAVKEPKLLLMQILNMETNLQKKTKNDLAICRILKIKELRYHLGTTDRNASLDLQFLKDTESYQFFTDASPVEETENKALLKIYGLV
jgi:hypothetical protein